MLSINLIMSIISAASFPNIVLLWNITREHSTENFFSVWEDFYSWLTHRVRPTGIVFYPLTDQSSPHSKEEVKVNLSKSGLCRSVTMMWLILLSNISICLIFLKAMKCTYLHSGKHEETEIEEISLSWNHGIFVYNVRMRLVWSYISYLKGINTI